MDAGNAKSRRAPLASPRGWPPSEAARARPRPQPRPPPAGARRGARRHSGAAAVGIKKGLPYSYNVRTRRRISFPRRSLSSRHDLKPPLLLNPPRYSYLLYVRLRALVRSADALRGFHTTPLRVSWSRAWSRRAGHDRRLADLPSPGERLFGRTVALLARRSSGVSFLPMLLQHLALNDVPTLARWRSRCTGSRVCCAAAGAGTM